MYCEKLMYRGNRLLLIHGNGASTQRICKTISLLFKKYRLLSLIAEITEVVDKLDPFLRMMADDYVALLSANEN